jgi:hypothetical protein
MMKLVAVGQSYSTQQLRRPFVYVILIAMSPDLNRLLQLCCKWRRRTGLDHSGLRTENGKIGYSSKRLRAGRQT